MGLEFISKNLVLVTVREENSCHTFNNSALDAIVLVTLGISLKSLITLPTIHLLRPESVAKLV